MKKLATFAMTSTLSLILAACGGGGGSTSTTTPVTPPVSQTCANGASDYPTCTPPVTPGNLQQTVPAPTYLATSDEVVTFNELNGFRKAIGLGLLAQSLPLDTASRNHSTYIVTNQIFSHVEDSTKPGFTGVNPSDRDTFAGYTSATLGGEVIGGGSAPTGIRGLINTIYHRDLLAFQGFTDVGISYMNGWSNPLVIDFGSKKAQVNASNFTTTYPFDKQINLPLTMMVESPNPFPDLSTSNSDFPTKTSSPISFYSVAGSTLSVTSFTVMQAGQTTPLSVRLLTAANDPNKDVQPNVAHIVGNAPFTANTQYVVNFVGSVNGIAINKTWSFTTGSSLNIGGGAIQ